MSRSKWALVPLVLLLSLDFWFTLAGQPYSYWQGSYHHCNEGSPPGRMLLKAGPGYFITAYILWVVAACTLVGRMPKYLDTAFVWGVVMGHAWGSSSWLPSMISITMGITLDEGAT